MQKLLAIIRSLPASPHNKPGPYGQFGFLWHYYYQLSQQNFLNSYGRGEHDIIIDIHSLYEIRGTSIKWLRHDVAHRFTTLELLSFPPWDDEYHGTCISCMEIVPTKKRGGDTLYFMSICANCRLECETHCKSLPIKWLMLRELILPELAAAIIALI